MDIKGKARVDGCLFLTSGPRGWRMQSPGHAEHVDSWTNHRPDACRLQCGLALVVCPRARQHVRLSVVCLAFIFGVQLALSSSPQGVAIIRGRLD
jgi:hypothetical protein